MNVRYLLRFDDICPAMNWSVWAEIEPLLARHGISPIIAVVPDNQDPKLNVHAARADFWAWVRDRQADGWCIALHGYQHRYLTRDGGIMGINAKSEFAGLPEDIQRDKLVRALGIFRDNGIRADAWVAPGHSFDKTTVKLLLELGIDTISDGFYPRPVQDLGAYWIPQQLWHFRPMMGGVWTVCLHCNAYGEQEMTRLRNWLAEFAGSMTTVDDVRRLYPARPASWRDRAFAVLMPALRSVRRRIKN